MQGSKKWTSVKTFVNKRESWVQQNSLLSYSTCSAPQHGSAQSQDVPCFGDVESGKVSTPSFFSDQDEFSSI